MILVNPAKAIKVNPLLGGTQKLYRCFSGIGWSKYVELTIDHTQLAADVSDHTLLIQDTAALALMPASFWTTVQADGGDIVVVDARSGRHFHRELEYINTAGGSEALALHVRMPNVSSARDEVLRIYYGNASANEPNESMAWASHWKFVSHMADNPADATQILDSTRNNNFGTKGAGAAAPTEVAGTVGRAQQGLDQAASITVADHASLRLTGDMTIIQVYRAADYAPTLYLVQKNSAKEFGANNQGTTNAKGRIRFYHGDGALESLLDASGVIATEGTWNVLGIVRSMTAQRAYLYESGALKSTGAVFTKTPIAGTDNVRLMGGTGTFTVTHETCELRLSSVALGAEENKLIYQAYLTPATLYGYGTEQSV